MESSQIVHLTKEAFKHAKNNDAQGQMTKNQEIMDAFQQLARDTMTTLMQRSAKKIGASSAHIDGKVDLDEFDAEYKSQCVKMLEEWHTLKVQHCIAQKSNNDQQIFDRLCRDVLLLSMVDARSEQINNLPFDRVNAGASNNVARVVKLHAAKDSDFNKDIKAHNTRLNRNSTSKINKALSTKPEDEQKSNPSPLKNQSKQEPQEEVESKQTRTHKDREQNTAQNESSKATSNLFAQIRDKLSSIFSRLFQPKTSTIEVGHHDNPSAAMPPRNSDSPRASFDNNVSTSLDKSSVVGAEGSIQAAKIMQNRQDNDKLISNKTEIEEIEMRTLKFANDKPEAGMKPAKHNVDERKQPSTPHKKENSRQVKPSKSDNLPHASTFDVTSAEQTTSVKKGR